MSTPAGDELGSACTSVAVPAAAAADADAEQRCDSGDRALVDGCVRGDRAAMGALYQRYQRRVYSLLLRMVGREDAEELAHDVFVRIYRGLHNFRGEAALGTWIYRLTMNVCLSFLARRSRRSRIDSGRVAAELAIEPPAPGPGNPWLRRRLELALAELPAGYRAVLTLHDVEGLNHQEIAAILGCRVGTSKSQLHKARMRMRQLLEEQQATAGRASEQGSEA